MEITTLCAVVATLRVVPNRSQFFQYESVFLSCGQQGNSSEWTVKMNTSKHINRECFIPRNISNKSSCFFNDLYPSDSGVYWCESATGECRDAVNITVAGGSVILESPVLPVMEGDDVTLCCRNNKIPSSSNLTADFYKDGRLIRSNTTGNMTILSVSKSDKGFYKCNIPGVGESPDGWLTVRAGRHDAPHSPVTTNNLLPVVVVCLSLVLLLCVMLLCFWRSHKGKMSPGVSYTDVTIIPAVQPKRFRVIDASSTFYSTVKPGNT